jgi:hypothetical protein
MMTRSSRSSKSTQHDKKEEGKKNRMGLKACSPIITSNFLESFAGSIVYEIITISKHPIIIRIFFQIRRLFSIASPLPSSFRNYSPPFSFVRSPKQSVNRHGAMASNRIGLPKCEIYIFRDATPRPSYSPLTDPGRCARRSNERTNERRRGRDGLGLSLV